MVIKEEIWPCSHVVTSIDNRHIHTWLQVSTSRCKLFLWHVADVAMVTGLHTSVNKTASLLLGKISQLLCFVNSFLSMNLPDNDDLERFLRDVDQMSKCCLFTNHSRCYAAVIRKYKNNIASFFLWMNVAHICIQSWDKRNLCSKNVNLLLSICRWVGKTVKFQRCVVPRESNCYGRSIHLIPGAEGTM